MTGKFNKDIDIAMLETWRPDSKYWIMTSFFSGWTLFNQNLWNQEEQDSQSLDGCHSQTKNQQKTKQQSLFIVLSERYLGQSPAYASEFKK